MKSEHRHELQTNDLNKYAEESIGFFRKYGNHIMIVVCIVSIAASALIYWQRVSNTRLEQAWSDLAFATQPAEFQFIVSDPSLSKTPAAPWARLQESDGRMHEGIRLMFTDRERAVREVEAAQNGYQDLLARTGVDPLIRERALFGHARALETLSDGKLDGAIEAYEKVLKEFPESLYKPMIDQQVKDLRGGTASSFYAWFAKQKPTTAVPSRLPADKGRGGADSKKGTLDLKDGPTIEVPDAQNRDLPVLDGNVPDDGKKGTKTGTDDKGAAKGVDPARAKGLGPKLETPVKGPELPDLAPKSPAVPSTPAPEKKVEAKAGEAKTPTAPVKSAEPAKKSDDKKGP